MHDGLRDRCGTDVGSCQDGRVEALPADFEWSAADVDPDDNQLGLTGSPTKVKKIENVVFQAKEAKKLTADDKQIEELMVELIASHTLG